MSEYYIPITEIEAYMRIAGIYSVDDKLEFMHLVSSVDVEVMSYEKELSDAKAPKK